MRRDPKDPALSGEFLKGILSRSSQATLVRFKKEKKGAAGV